MKKVFLITISVLMIVFGNVSHSKDKIEDWRDHVASTDVDKYLPEVLKQLKSSYPEHSKRLLAIRLLGFDTRGVEKDVLGRPMKQRLTIWTAYESDEKSGHALVIQNKCFTFMPVPDIPLKNCFQPDSLEHANLDEKGFYHWFTPLDQLPDQSQYGIGRGGSGTGIITRLILSIALLVCGSLLAVSLLNKKVPSLNETMVKLVPMRSMIGVVSIMIGVLFLFFDLLSPFDDFVPLVAILIAGLMLGIELLIKKSSQTMVENSTVGDAVNKVHEVLVANKEKIKRLENKQVPIGLACMVLSIIHLFFGNMIII